MSPRVFFLATNFGFFLSSVVPLFLYDTRFDSAVQVGLKLIAILLSQPHAGYGFCHLKQPVVVTVVVNVPSS